jgi:GDPmannose 4,6-dehydratase
MRAAIITGIAGQDGSFLTELLIEKGYTVYGIVRFSSYSKPIIKHERLFILRGDLTDSPFICSVIKDVSNDPKWDRIEVYNLAAQSQVKVSFEQPEWTTRVNALGPLNILEAIRQTADSRFRFYQAGTSEMFGKVRETPQCETTPFYPRSPYGCAKVYAYWITKNYREAYGMFACTGILFNHESERRGEEFVTRKITRAIGQRQFPIRLGNIEARRDWGYAPDYVEAMWMMLQLDEPEDFVVSTGQNHSVREFVENAFRATGIEIVWDGSTGKHSNTGEILVTVDQTMYRPTEVDVLVGDSGYFFKKTGWKPKVSFEELVAKMVKSDELLFLNNKLLSNV